MCGYFELRRNVLAIMTFFGIAISYILRVNLSIAIVDMTVEHIVPTANGSFTVKKYFDWDSVQKGNVLSSFFYGYLLTQIIGGYLASIYGGVYVFGLTVGSASMLTLLTPVCANIDIYGLILLRAMEGACLGAIFPCLGAIWSKWAPLNETTKLLTISNSGVGIGSVLAFFSCGFITHIFGWQYTFYIPGILGLVWYSIWYLYMVNDPRDDPYTSEEELASLKGTLHEKTDDISYPWKKMFTSMSVWAVLLMAFTHHCVCYIMITELPMYLQSRFAFNASNIGTLLVGPYLLRAIICLLSGRAADNLRQKMPTSMVRRLFSFLGPMIESALITAIGFINSPAIVILCLTTSIGIGGSVSSGYWANMMDLAPQYSSVLMGVANTVGTAAGAISPNVAGYIVKNGTVSEWKMLFMLTATLNAVGAVTYCILMSGERQPWALLEYDDNTVDKQSKNSTDAENGHLNKDAIS